MKPFARFTTPVWLGGLAIAGAGVLLARLVAPALAGPWQPVVKVAGELVAFGGLLVIAGGLSWRRRGDSTQ